MKPLITLLALFATTAVAEPRPLPWLGLSFTWSATNDTTHMMHVRAVAPGGPAEKAGVRAHDFVDTIDGERVDFGDELEFLLYLVAKRPGDRLRLTLIREGRRVPVTVTLAQLPESARAKWDRNLELARNRRAKRKAASQ